MPARLIDLVGLDRAGRVVARGFVQHLRQSGADTSRVTLLESDEAQPAALRALLAGQAESRKAASLPFEPVVVIVAAVWTTEALDAIALIGEISRTLEVAVPGSQSISLIALVPPVTATDEDKLRTLTFFGELENVIGTIPFLDIVFVNQITRAVYETMENPSNREALDDDLFELLQRQTLDPDLDKIIRSVGHGAVRNRKTVAGRKVCYSTTGTHRLVYLWTETFTHLETRFQSQMLWATMLDVELVTVDQREALQVRADTLVDDLTKTLSGQVAGLSITDEHWRNVIGEDSGSPIDDSGSPIKEAFARALETLLADLDKTLEHLTESVRDVLLELLEDGTAYLAGPRLFLDALEGIRIVEVDENIDEPSGVRRFNVRVCHGPLLAEIVNLAQTESSLAAIVPTPPAPGDKDFPDWTIEAALALRAAAEETEPALSPPTRVSAVTLQRLIEHAQHDPCDEDRSHALVEAVRAVTADEVGQVNEALEEKRREEAELQQRATMYGFFAKYFTRWSAYRELAEQIGRIVAECDSLEALIAQTIDVFKKLADTILVPHVVRVRVAARFRDAVRDVAGEFRNFVRTATNHVEQRWDAARRVPEWMRPTESTIVTPARLEILFHGGCGERGPRDHVDAGLAFLPPQPDANGPDVSYRECETLKDHFLVGPRSLLDRCADYARTVFGPLRSIDILDIIELEGEESALDLLTQRVAHTKSFLPFSPGLLPLVRDAQFLRAVFLVRVPGADRSRLSPRGGTLYGHLFEPEYEFLESVPTLITITCLQTGFPAFVIHALSEARQLAEATAAGAPDLWPQ